MNGTHMLAIREVTTSNIPLESELARVSIVIIADSIPKHIIRYNIGLYDYFKTSIPKSLNISLNNDNDSPTTLK